MTQSRLGRLWGICFWSFTVTLIVSILLLWMGVNITGTWRQCLLVFFSCFVGRVIADWRAEARRP